MLQLRLLASGERTGEGAPPRNSPQHSLQCTRETRCPVARSQNRVSQKVKEMHYTPNGLVQLTKGKVHIKERRIKTATRVVNKFLNSLEEIYKNKKTKRKRMRRVRSECSPGSTGMQVDVSKGLGEAGKVRATASQQHCTTVHQHTSRSAAPDNLWLNLQKPLQFQWLQISKFGF